MDGDEFSAAGAFPSPHLLPHEFFNADLFNGAQIVDHAHSVFCSVPFVELLKPFARECLTFKAECSIGALQFSAVFDDASHARFWFTGIGSVASGARIDVALVRHAKRAVHAAGGDKEFAFELLRLCGHWRYDQKISFRSGGTICAYN